MPTKSKNKENKGKKLTSHSSKSKTHPFFVRDLNKLNQIFLFGIVLILSAFVVLNVFQNQGFFWLLLVVGSVISINSILLRFDFAVPFLLKYVLTMVKTKRLVNFIESLAYHAKWFEKICILGSILGFGVAGVDYWFARKRGGWKRVIIILVSALLLALFFTYFCSILFNVPALAPLFIPCLIGFILLGFGGMSLAMLIGYGVLALIGLFSDKQLCPSVAPVLPGVPIPGLGVVIPLIAWVSLAMVLIIHEFSHGIMMVYYKEKIKSVGLLVAGFFPMGAFVEQDDKTFNVLSDKKAINVLSAGSASNLFTMALAWIFLILFLFALSPLDSVVSSEYNKTFGGVKIKSVSDRVSYCGIDVNAPAKGLFLAEDKVKQINGKDINGIYLLNAEFRNSKGDINFLVERISLDTNKPYDLNIIVTPFKFEELGIQKIGVEFEVIQTGYSPPGEIVFVQTVASLISQILLFFVIISFAAGSFNYFPSDPFDGGRMAKIMLAPYFGFMKMNEKETQKLIGRLFIWLLIISLTLNMIPYLTMVV
ncbi:MAG: site-2 protease family protein [archaeon]|jgi:membrane-associated protease RseP (regulator of RpoE activity)